MTGFFPGKGAAACFLLCAVFGGGPLAQGAEAEAVPDSVDEELEASAAEAMVARDTCLAVSEAFREALRRAYPQNPDFPPTPCMTGFGREVMMTCSAVASSVVRNRQPDDLEYSCRTKPVSGATSGKTASENGQPRQGQQGQQRQFGAAPPAPG